SAQRPFDRETHRRGDRSRRAPREVAAGDRGLRLAARQRRARLAAARARRAATAAIRSVGEDVVPLIRTRLAAGDVATRRALDAILADLGGKDAFSTLLQGLATAEGEAAKAATLAVRQRVKDAGARERNSYLAETEKYLKKNKDGSPSAIAAALKILGYLEDPSAVPTLLAYATAKDQPASVKQEALIALRFALQDSKPNA